MPYTLTYRSEATREMLGTDIHNILEASERNNRELGITGCLIYKTPYFIQILEGDRESVLKLYEQIEQDDRHHMLEILHEDEYEGRMFRGWRMAFSDVEKDLRWEREELLKAKIDHVTKFGGSSFAYRVFWYNVGQLLETKGFYRVPGLRKT